MDQTRKSKGRARRVTGAIRSKDLHESEWIGFGAAVEWIACRGRNMPEHEYKKRLAEATETLVDRLCQLDPYSCEAIVEGIPTQEPDNKYGSVDHGVWPNVELNDAEYSLDDYYLALVDEKDEWGGSVENRSGGWTRLRIRTYFVRENWKAGSLELDPAKQPDPNDSKDLPKGSFRESVIARSFIEYILAHIPDDLVPPPDDDIVQLVRERFPDISRPVARRILKQVRPKNWPSKRGPRGPRQPDRNKRWEKFRRLMIAADLQN